MTEERIRELIAESIDAFGKKILAEIDSRIGELKSEKKRIYEARRFKNRPWWADDAHEKDRVHEIKSLIVSGRR